MKEWSNKPSDLVEASSSPVKATSSSSVIKSRSSPASLTSRIRQRDLSCITRTSSSPVSLASSDLSKSPVKTVSSPTSLVSGSSSQSLTKTASSPISLTSGSSGIATVGKGTGQRAASAAALATPVVGGAVAGTVALGFYGISNIIKYGKNEKSGAQAAKDTVAGSAGLGLSAGLGIAAANAIAGTSIALGSTVVVPIAAGVGAAYASIRIWNRLFFKEKSPSKTR